MYIYRDKNHILMVEYNKYDDLKEQQLISNLIYGATLSEQPQQFVANNEMYN